MTSKNNKAPLLYYIKLCASFQIHWWIQTGVTVRKCSIRVKIGEFLSRVTLKFDEWSWKIIGRHFCTTLSFVQHFQAIGIFKLELQSGNAQFGSKLAIFCPGWLHDCLPSRLFRKHQNSASFAFVRGIPIANDQWRGKKFHLMTSSCSHWTLYHNSRYASPVFT